MKMSVTQEKKHKKQTFIRSKGAIFLILRYENQMFHEMNMVAKFVCTYVGIAEIRGEEER